MSNGKGSKVRCWVCGYKIRGSNHDKGKHHKDAINGNKKRPTVRDRNSKK